MTECDTIIFMVYNIDFDGNINNSIPNANTNILNNINICNMLLIVDVIMILISRININISIVIILVLLFIEYY